MGRETVLVESRPPLCRIVLNRPEVLNALSGLTMRELDSAFRELAADAAIKGIVLTSSNGALAGADITELAVLETPDAARDMCMRAHPILLAISALKKPVVAALNGPVLGGGSSFFAAYPSHHLRNDPLNPLLLTSSYCQRW